MNVWLVGIPELCMGSEWIVSACRSASVAQSIQTFEELFEAEVGGKDNLEALDWDEFRDLELALIKKLAAAQPNPEGQIIVFDGGRTMTSELVNVFRSVTQKSGVPVVHCRQIGIKVDGVQSVLLERAKKGYSEASSYEFVIAEGDGDMDRIEAELLGFLRRIVYGQGSDMALVGEDILQGVDESKKNEVLLATKDALVPRIPVRNVVDPVTLVGGTFFVSLTCKDVRELIDSGKILAIAEGMSAMELRVDLLQSWDMDFVMDQCARLRRSCPLPVIYTVRTMSQGGAFPDNEEQYFELSSLAIRCGFQWVDMESHWSEKSRLKFLAQVAAAKGTRVIGSHHFKSSNGGDKLLEQFNHCAHHGRVDIVKVVIMAMTLDDALKLVQVSRNLTLPKRIKKNSRDESETYPGVIALAMGQEGITSRVMNQHFTPVSHPCMNTKAAPGQIPLVDILHARRIISVHQVPKKSFYVFGANLKRTILDKYINSGFQYCHVQHTAEICETDSIFEVEKLMKSNQGFGGACVQFPLKEKIMELADSMTEPAHFIGAANTIIVTKDNKIHAHNTDWIGIMKPLHQYAIDSSARALIIGRGSLINASIYALMKLGFGQEKIDVVEAIMRSDRASDGTPKKKKRRTSSIGSSKSWKYGMSSFIPNLLSSLCQVSQAYSHVIVVSETAQQRLMIELEIVSSWDAVARCVNKPTIFFDAAADSKILHSKEDMMKLAESVGCTTIQSTEYGAGAAWEQFRRWLGDRSESMALAAASSMKNAFEIQHIRK